MHAISQPNLVNRTLAAQCLQTDSGARTLRFLPAVMLIPFLILNSLNDCLEFGGTIPARATCFSGFWFIPYRLRIRRGIRSLTMSYFHTGTCTIIGAMAFHGPVRDGKGWGHHAMVIRHNGD